MKTLETIQQIVSACPGKQVLLTSPIVIKCQPAPIVFTCWGIAADSDNGLWLMDGSGMWHGPLEETDHNADVVINTIHRRLQILQLKAA